MVDGQQHRSRLGKALAAGHKAAQQLTDRAFRLPWQMLPVAGLDCLAAQSVLYTLRTSLDKQQASEVATAWLQTLQLAQVASDRLLHALSDAQTSLRFWRNQLRSGSHGSFLLLARGPGSFLADVLAALRRPRDEDGNAAPVAASDRIEERVVALQLLSTQLAEGLAAVHSAAALLRLTEPDAGQQQGGLDASACSAIEECLETLVEVLHQVVPEAAHLLKHDASVVKQVQRAALSQTLAVSFARRPSMEAPQQEGAGGASSSGSSGRHRRTSVQQVQRQISRVSTLLGVPGQQLAQQKGTKDARSALAAASFSALQLGPLVAVPQWCRMPSTLQRHWIRCTIAGVLGLSAGVYLIKHSRLAGSSDLDEWVLASVAAARGAFWEHVVEPLEAVGQELFATLRDRPAIVSTAEFEADKQSLLRMLDEFQRDHPEALQAAVPAPAAAPAAGPAGTTELATAAAAAPPAAAASSADQLDVDAVNRGMQMVMSFYETDLKHPIRSLITGELARTLLIQMQRLKLDTEAAMLELDQVLQANELTITLMAAVPALGLFALMVRGLWLLLRMARRPPDPQREALPCRMAMAELERALAGLASCSSGSAGASAAAGMVLFKLFVVFREAQRVFVLKDATSRYSEWPYLQADLLELVTPGVPASAKLELHRRMLRTYGLLQP